MKANHGGRTHDARVWSSSQLSRHMFRQYENGRQNMWLIGKKCANTLSLYSKS